MDESAGISVVGVYTKMQVKQKWLLVLFMTLLSFVIDPYLSHATPEGIALHVIQKSLDAEMNWKGNDPCQTWDGVKCLKNHVVQLILSGRGLNGAIPKEIGSLSSLNILDLSNNSINGSIPDEMSKLSNLHNLSLYSNHLSGRFPTSLLRLNATIDLRCNYFTGPKPIGLAEHLYTGNCLDSDLDSHMRFCPSSPNCVFFYSQPENAQSGYTPPKNSQDKTWTLIAVSVSSFLLLAIILVGIYITKMKRNQRKNRQMLLGILSVNETTELWEPPVGVRRFELKELSKATGGFNKTYEIGFGGFGRVYKASLDDGSIVAIKRALPSCIQGHKQFQNEIIILSRLHHRCLVKLEGFCHEAGEQILVYEFMKNGNLNDLLRGDYRKEILSWSKRIEISLAVAQGLDYLHSFSKPPVIHRDIKPSNILLDDHFNAKLSDFGISKSTAELFNTHISTGPAGTFGYFDPQYFLRQQLTPASDVYSFGIVLLVLVSGQSAIDHNRTDDFNLAEWVKVKFQEGDIKSIVDPNLKDDFNHEDVRTVTELALSCAAFDICNRPSMKEVVSVLKSLLKKHDASQSHGSYIVDNKVSAKSFHPSTMHSVSNEGHEDTPTISRSLSTSILYGVLQRELSSGVDSLSKEGLE